MSIWLKLLISFAAAAAIVYGKELFVKWFFKEYGKHLQREMRTKSKLASTQQNIAGQITNTLRRVINDNVHIEVIVDNRIEVGPKKINQILVSLKDTRYIFDSVVILQILVCPDLTITTKPDAGSILEDFSEGRLIDFLCGVKGFVRNYDKGIISA